MAINTLSTGLSSLSQGNWGASASRAKKTAEQAMQAIDTDQSGSLSKAEFVAFGEKMKAGGPGGASAASSASQTRGAQAPTPPSSDELFTAADKNGDAGLSIDELSSMMAEADTRAAAGGGPGGAGGARGAGGPPPGPPPGGGGGGKMGGAGGASSATQDSSSSSATTDPADANGDGTVSVTEQATYDMTHPTEAE